jgi:hypothetical protein
MRIFGSVPDPRRRAHAVISELRHGEGWTPAAQQTIAARDIWLSTAPAMLALEQTVRDLLERLAKA